MDAIADLQKEKSKILSAISLAASEEKTALVLSESQKLEKVELLINRHRQIILELEELRGNKFDFPSLVNTTKQERYKKNAELRPVRPIDSRELGEKLRKKFLEKLEWMGTRLQLIKGKTIYRTKSGKRVGIAVATERQPNRWFLGLPVGGFDHAVLLCQRKNEEVIEVPLPEKFFIKYGQVMSQSKGQLKFNVVHRDGDLLIQVPGTDGISGNSFSGDYTFLL
ncbi:MAG: hypothetical protein D9V46_00935 [Deltaproteobacteria bacterium]|uniref:hypothetical protein n=1 Tax=Hydrosulfovibrio ferrireducens TaxID=2934181 RepID=UPI0012273DD6|nr:MAG: hypothetical protein D9V46_00935 [Deltaproteobacteria bacterium]